MFCHLSKARLAGFSLVELLVTITIIGMLIALLLPAVQAAREAARRIACCNNLRQIGIGLQNYHAARDCFPPGCIEPRSKRPGGRQYAWSAFLLPFIEQQSLYDTIDFSQRYNSPTNASPAAIVVPTYVCASSLRSVSKSIRGPSDYGGMFGEAIPPHPAGWKADNGVMIYDRAIRIDDICDGTSNTLVIVEDSQWPDGEWINGLNIFDQKYPINFVPSNPILWENEMRSNHPGGANGAFCDGSVRFLPETMDLTTLKALCTRAGGEVVGDF